MTELPDIIAHLRQACKEAGGVEEWANRHRVYPGFIFEMLAGSRLPTERVLGVLGYQSRYSEVEK